MIKHLLRKSSANRHLVAIVKAKRKKQNGGTAVASCVLVINLEIILGIFFQCLFEHHLHVDKFSMCQFHLAGMRFKILKW